MTAAIVAIAPRAATHGSSPARPSSPVRTSDTNENDEPESAGGDDAPVADVAGDGRRREGFAEGGAGRDLGLPDDDRRPSGKARSGTACESGAPAKAGAPGDRPEDHRQRGEDSGHGEVRSEVVELPGPVEVLYAGALDVEGPHDRGDADGCQRQDADDQQWLDAEGPLRRGCRLGLLPRSLPRRVGGRHAPRGVVVHGALLVRRRDTEVARSWAAPFHPCRRSPRSATADRCRTGDPSDPDPGSKRPVVRTRCGPSAARPPEARSWHPRPEGVAAVAAGWPAVGRSPGRTSDGSPAPPAPAADSSSVSSGGGGARASSPAGRRRRAPHSMQNLCSGRTSVPQTWHCIRSSLRDGVERLQALGTLSPMAGRFAPSPTGPLHVGNLRTALIAWLFARVGR